MALTPGRAVAVALVLCAGAVALLLPPQPRRLERGGTYARSARDQALRELRAVQGAVRVRVLRDSVDRLVAGGRQPVSPLFVGRWSDDQRDWIEARLAQILEGRVARSPTGVAFVRDSMFRGVPTLFYAIPDSAGAPCVAIYAEGNFAPGPWLRRPPFRRLAPAMLGPCAYYARFGPAGSAVTGWLRRGGTALALTSPTFPPPAWKPPATTSWMGSLVGRPGGVWFGDPRLAFPLTLNGCVAGRLEACRDFVLGERMEPRGLQALGVRAEVNWSLQTDEVVFLSDVLTEFGPERFTRFWTAAGSLDEAFRTAFGASLDSWTASWARARFGRGPALPAIRAGALGLSLGTAAGFLALAVLIAYRRRVAR